MLLRLLLVITLLLPGAARPAALCAQRPAAAAALAQLQQVMADGRFVTYQPTALRVIDGRASRADAASIERDLRALRPRFDGLITYTAANGAEQVPDIAARLGFRAMLMGVWDIRDPRELDNAVAAARRQPQLVRGLIVGNEVVFGHRGSWEEVAAAVRAARARVPALAITSTEPFHLLLTVQAQPLLREMDLLTANVHPVFQPWFRTAPTFNAADFVVRVTQELAAAYCGPVLVKETGEPTAPAAQGYSPARQRDFYRALARQLPPQRRRAFAYFDAFDAPWRAADTSPTPGPHPEEAHWGLFDAQRRPKPVLQVIPPLPSTPQ